VSFFGLRFEIEGVNEIEEMEERSHRLFIESKKSGLRCYWANFAEPGEKYYAFLGKQIGIMGVENLLEVSLGVDELKAIIDDVTQKLSELGYEETPKLLLQWLPDA